MRNVFAAALISVSLIVSAEIISTRQQAIALIGQEQAVCQGPSAPTTTTSPTTTSTSVPVHKPKPRAQRTMATTKPTPPPAPGKITVSSTAYSWGCGTPNATTANGETPRIGGVASNRLPMGSKWRVLSGPMEGNVYRVNDRGADFDIFMSNCTVARNYGRHSIQIKRVG